MIIKLGSLRGPWSISAILFFLAQAPVVAVGLHKKHYNILEVYYLLQLRQIFQNWVLVSFIFIFSYDLPVVLSLCLVNEKWLVDTVALRFSLSWFRAISIK